MEDNNMTLTKDTKLADLDKKYPWLLDEVVKLDPAFKVLKTPVGKMLIKKATIEDAGKKSGLGTDAVIKQLDDMIKAHK